MQGSSLAEANSNRRRSMTLCPLGRTEDNRVARRGGVGVG